MDLPEQRMSVTECMNKIASLLRGPKFTLHGVPPECAITIWRETPFHIYVNGGWSDLVVAVQKHLEDQRRHW